MKSYRLNCEVLSPLHIGTGEELEPLDYIIRNETLHRISFERLVSRLTNEDRQRLEAIIDSGDLQKIRAFVQAHPEALETELYRVGVASAVKSRYGDKINDIGNQLLVHPFVRTEGYTVPIIPGSSLKGAIRTAVVSELAKKSGLPKPRETREEYDFEARVLGYTDAKNDPFRGVKLRDAQLVNDDMIVREVKNLRRGDDGIELNSIQMMCEVSQSRVSGNAVSFKTELLVDDTLQGVKILSKVLSVEEFVASCNRFYRDKLVKEHQKFYRNSNLEQFSQALLDVPMEKDTFLIRMGRYSGVESVTLDEYRNPKPPGKKNKWGTSRNVAEGLYPMGWVKVSVEST